MNFRIILEVIVAIFFVFGVYSALYDILLPAIKHGIYKEYRPSCILFFTKEQCRDVKTMENVIENTVDDAQKCGFFRREILVITEEKTELRPIPYALYLDSAEDYFQQLKKK